MKRIKNWLLSKNSLRLLSAALILVAAGNANAGEAGKVYLKGDVGYDFLYGKIKLTTDCYWAPNLSSSIGIYHITEGKSENSKILGGGMTTAGLGYSITDKFRVDTTFGYVKQRESFDFPKGAFELVSGIDQGKTTPSPELKDEKIVNESWLIMANVYYDFNNCSDWTPFVNAGVGYGSSKISAHRILGYDKRKIYHKKDFALGVGAGAAYKLLDGVYTDLSYRMSYMKRRSSFEDREKIDNNEAAASVTVELPSMSHSVNFGLRIEF